MKKLMALLLALTLPFTGALALAEELVEIPDFEGAALPVLPNGGAEEEDEDAYPPVEPNYDRLIVGSTTEMSGNFFSEMFGNNTADIDARTLLHGYNLMEWQHATGSYGINRSVVSGLDVSDDAEGNRTYIVAIYTDLEYSDGTKITAADYAFSMLLSIDPAMAAIGAATVQSDYIVGIDEYKRGETDVLTGMRILNDQLMSITVKAEYRPFFYELALLDYNPYPIHVIAPGCEVVDTGAGVTIRNANGAAGARVFNAELLRETILDPETGYLNHPSVVSGPYVLDSYDPETHTANFSINSHYKGNSYGQKPLVPEIIFRPVSPDTMIEEFRTGEVDLLNKCVSADVISAGMELTGSGDVMAANYTRSGYSFFSFNCEKPTVSSAAVRQAIAHCLDKDALVAAYVSNYGLAVDGYYGIGQWVYQLANGTQAPPIVEPAAGATPEMLAAYEEEVAAWEEVNLDGLTKYPLDLAEAARLLDADGWTLDREGGKFDAGTDDVRCKQVDGQLVALDLTLIYPEGNAIADALEETFIGNLAQVGVKLSIEAKPTKELLDLYYRAVPRDCDMFYLATNFATVFDPSMTFSTDDAYLGSANRTGIVDDELYARAVDMRQTEPGDVLAYCQKWVAFQERWTEVLPAIPVYSNVYFDFYRNTLQNYEVSSGQTWADAIVGAYLGEPVLAEDLLEDADGLVIL